MGRLLGIATAAEPRGDMTTRDSATITLDAGVDADRRGGPGPRQVTVIANEAWTATCADLDATVDWTTRRANLLVEGIDLAETTGSRLRVGDAVLEVTGETKPCGRMDQQHQGLRAALQPSWRGGVTCRVVEPGAIAVGDAADLM